MDSDLTIAEDEDVVITTVGRYKTSVYISIFLLTLFISWPSIYLFMWTYPPKSSDILSTSAFMESFASGSGTPVTSGKGNLNNTLLTDKGREEILWWSLLFAFSLAVFLTFIVYINLK
jgi:hypothetical protein